MVKQNCKLFSHLFKCQLGIFKFGVTCKVFVRSCCLGLCWCFVCVYVRVLMVVSSCSVCPDLILMALERKDYFLCQLCLQFFPDIPEAVTCACLKAFIR